MGSFLPADYDSNPAIAVSAYNQYTMVLIGLAGYLLPVPMLIWAWVRWGNSKPRFASFVAQRLIIFGTDSGFSS